MKREVVILEEPEYPMKPEGDEESGGIGVLYG